MNTITTDDIACPAYTHAVINTEHDVPHLDSLHGNKADADDCARRAGSGDRIVGRFLRVVPLDGPAPAGYRSTFASMRDYLIAG